LLYTQAPYAPNFAQVAEHVAARASLAGKTLA
jgi:hypothetical protein